MRNDIEFRVPKPDNGGYWQNRLEEVIVDERGPQGKASYTVGGKMYGLEFREQWYIVGADSAVSCSSLIKEIHNKDPTRAPSCTRATKTTTTRIQ